GLDSATFPKEDRLRVWQKLSSDWKLPNLEALATTCTLAALDPYIDAMLKGDSKGRVIVAMG
ncbi:MAG: oxidoreductase, partial [Bacteroidota bacterium]